LPPLLDPFRFIAPKWLIPGPQTVAGGSSTQCLVTGTAYQFSDGQKIVRLERLVLTDGKEMRVDAR